MGKNRAEALRRLGHQITIVADIAIEKAKSIAHDNCKVTTHWEEVTTAKEVEAVVVATVHQLAPQISISALRNGKHVLCEKPLGRNVEEAREIFEASEQAGKILKTGFNYRYYPGISKAHKMMKEGAIGKPKYIRCVLGHGAKPGYDNSWKTDASKCGGGALLDPGIHCIDLFRWFLGELREACFYTMNAFWNIDVEDNSFVIFKSEDGNIAMLQTSITEWENILNFQITGTNGLIRVSGRSGYYGPQKIRYTSRWSWLNTDDGTVKIDEKTFPQQDLSFQRELEDFVTVIETNKKSHWRPYDGLRATEIVDIIYKADNNKVRLSPTR